METHEVEVFGFYARLPPKVMEFMELKPGHRSRRYRDQFISFLGAMQGCNLVSI
jgi:hypothetical protein